MNESEIYERLGTLAAKVDAIHDKLDDINHGLRDKEKRIRALEASAQRFKIVWAATTAVLGAALTGAVAWVANGIPHHAKAFD